MTHTLDSVERILRLKVTRVGNCYEWTGSRDQDGYGKIWIEGKERRVHRVAAMLWLGMELDDPDVRALHTCDNPPCFRVEHLYVGTQMDNVLDAVERGRHHYPNGNDHKMNEAMLSKKLASDIRKRGGWARKIPGGPLGAGLPDIIGVYRRYGLFIETKLPGKEKTLTRLQAATIDGIKAAGGIALVITSRAQLKRVLDKIEEVVDG